MVVALLTVYTKFYSKKSKYLLDIHGQWLQCSFMHINRRDLPTMHAEFPITVGPMTRSVGRTEVGLRVEILES